MKKSWTGVRHRHLHAWENEITIINLMANLPDYGGLKGLAYRNRTAMRPARVSWSATWTVCPSRCYKAASYPGGKVNIFGSRSCYGAAPSATLTPVMAQMKCTVPSGAAALLKTSSRNRPDHRSDRLSYFYFTDPNFMAWKAGKRVLKLAALLKERNIRFGIEARANDIEPETTRAHWWTPGYRISLSAWNPARTNPEAAQ